MNVGSGKTGSVPVLTKEEEKLLARQDLEGAQFYFWMACTHSRLHDTYAAQALATYGDHGSPISGCVRDHFPDAVKDHLRGLARAVSENLLLAYKARPRGVRLTTMAALGRAVARRDGCGYYGPRA